MTKPNIALHAILSLPCWMACVDEPGPVTDEGLGLLPVEGAWEIVFDGQIAAEVDGGDDPRNVLHFQIGGLAAGDNFSNRGDVEVRYDMPPIGPQGAGDMQIEMQRFSGDPLAVRSGAIDAIRPWIYRGALGTPREKDRNGEACTEDTAFVAGCSIRVYYEGLTQPVRTGANLRVHLPVDFRGRVDVVTEDNVWPDGTYIDRSNVHIDGLYGSATVELGAGAVDIKLAEDILAAPTCARTDALAREANAACDAAGWSGDCGCFEDFGLVNVFSHAPNAIDVRVDAPARLFARVTAINESEPQASLGCAAELRCDDFDACVPEPGKCTATEPWQCLAYLNAPPQAPAGTGYQLRLSSAGCGEIPFHEGPESFGQMPDSEFRGDLVVCSDCIGE